MKNTKVIAPGRIFFAVFLLFVTASFCHAAQKETITFSSNDSITITADIYKAHPDDAPFILLFHQAGWSRGEYKETAPKLNRLGFNCMAVDQRSGGEVNEVINQTKLEADKAGKKTTYIDALADLEAALKYAKTKFPKSKIILWGSSYSAALVIKIAGDHVDLIDGVLAFSPGEYFKDLGGGADYITKSAKNVKCPLFVTSAKNEKSYWEDIFNAVPSKSKYSFLPKTEGSHGSRALWSKFKDHKVYWNEVEGFLKKHF